MDMIRAEHVSVSFVLKNSATKENSGFIVAFCSGKILTLHSILESWQSERMRRTRNPVYSLWVSGV